MFICEKCGKIYEDDEIPTHVEHHPYGDGTADEVFADMECSCGGDIVEAVKCDRCGEYLPETSTDFINGYHHIICDKCYDEMYSSDKVLDIAQSCEETTKIEINASLLSKFTPKEIEFILFQHIRQHTSTYYVRINEYAEDDKEWTADKLFELEKERNKQ